MKRVSIDLPEWLIKVLDEESDRIGIARQALVKMILVKAMDQKEKPQ